MENDLLKTLASIAGIGGISLGVVLLIFRRAIEALPLGNITREHKFWLMRLIILLTFTIAAIGLLAYVGLTVFEASTRLAAELGKSSQALNSIQAALDSTKRDLQTEREKLGQITNVVEKTRYPNLQEIETNVTLDLTRWQKVPEHERTKVKRSATPWKIRTIVAKATEDVKYYYDDCATGGLEPQLVCLTHPSVQSKNTDSNRVGGENLERYLIDVDISKEAPQVPFVMELQETFWNSFQGDTKEWAAVPTNYPVNQLSFEIHFPPEKPMRKFVLLAYPDLPNQPRNEASKPQEVEASADGLSIRWLIRNPRLRYIYRIDWEW